MNLPIFQQLAEHLGKSLYDNQAEVTLVSKAGFIVGSNRHSDKLGRPLTEAGLVAEWTHRRYRQRFHPAAAHTD